MLIVPTICKYAGCRIEAWSILDLDPGWLRVAAAFSPESLLVEEAV
ncbi:MAG: hypothetical protein QGH25_21485 [Candidatus Latescibacteria bacterium]|nr:hypothetical protein [Candidatus Latescibacterota bacterium]